MHDNDPEVLETEKQRNLKKEQHKYSTPNKNAPGWNQHLASASEAAVKADKETGSPSELQEHTVNYVKARHHSTDSPTSKSTSKSAYEGEERPDAGEATYDREKVEGPLKGSGA
ncbi:hypothetical protein K474DRAFT_1604172 [Panus rudis PR-1116 ss-1]|nr:hypothetical protein K474DRAFT_1604172 [Panus rudis PR-1116 ss-1]